MYFAFNELQYEHKFVRHVHRGCTLPLCSVFFSCFLVYIFNQINSSCLTVGGRYDASLSLDCN
jgi:hypothetical protein